MTADTVTHQRLSDLWVALETATHGIARLIGEAQSGDIDPAEAAIIVNETIQNLVNEAR